MSLEQKSKLSKKVDLALQAKKLKKARNLLRKIIELDPNDIRSRLRLGEILFQLQEKDEALDLLAHVGDYYRSHGFLLKSVAVYKKMLEVSPERWQLHGELATLYFQLGMAPEAIKQYKTQVKALFKQGRVVKGLNVIRSMLELEPGNITDRIRLGEAFSRHERYEEAAREFKSVMALLEKRGDTGALWLQVAERYLHHNPRDVEVARELAGRMVTAGRHSHALPWLQRCFEENTADTQTLDLLATCFAVLGQPTKAIAILKILARLHEKRGLSEERDAAFMRVLELDLKDPTAAKALGRETAEQETAAAPDDLVLDWDLPDQGAAQAEEPPSIPMDDDDDDEPPPVPEVIGEPPKAAPATPAPPATPPATPPAAPPTAPPPIPDDDDDDVEFGFEDVFKEGAAEVTLVQPMDQQLLDELGIADTRGPTEEMVDFRTLQEQAKSGQQLTLDDLIRKGIKLEPSEAEELEFFLTAGLNEEANLLINEILERNKTSG